MKNLFTLAWIGILGKNIISLWNSVVLSGTQCKKENKYTQHHKDTEIHRDLNRFSLIPLFIYTLIPFLVLSQLSCSVYETFVNISRLKFKLDNVSDFRLSGISLANKTKIEDFTASEVLRITSDFAQGKLPVSFVLNVEAKNPNDGTGGYLKTNATLKNFPWRLFLDDKETISGDIGAPVSVPGTGEASNIPLTIGLDLLQFFNEKGYESILNLALNIGGYSGGTSKIALFAKPTVTTSLGDIKYPEEIKIVDFEYTN